MYCLITIVVKDKNKWFKINIPIAAIKHFQLHQVGSHYYYTTIMYYIKLCIAIIKCPPYAINVVYNTNYRVLTP